MKRLFFAILLVLIFLSCSKTEEKGDVVIIEKGRTIVIKDSSNIIGYLSITEDGSLLLKNGFTNGMGVVLEEGRIKVGKYLNNKPYGQFSHIDKNGAFKKVTWHHKDENPFSSNEVVAANPIVYKDNSSLRFINKALIEAPEVYIGRSEDTSKFYMNIYSESYPIYSLVLAPNFDCHLGANAYNFLENSIHTKFDKNLIKNDTVSIKLKCIEDIFNRKVIKKYGYSVNLSDIDDVVKLEAYEDY